MINKIVCKNCKAKLNTKSATYQTKEMYKCDSCKYYCYNLDYNSKAYQSGFIFEIENATLLSYSVKSYYTETRTKIIVDGIDYGFKDNIPFTYDEHFRLYRQVIAGLLFK